MKSSQTVWLTADQKKAVKDGDPSARSLLVREGGEIDEARYENIEGAAELIEGRASKKAEKDEAPKAKAKH